MGLPNIPGDDFGTLCKKKYWTTPREIDEGLIMIMCQMSIEEVLETLREKLRVSGDYNLPIGFGTPDSYRGSYDEVAFEPKRNTSLSQSIANVESAIGKRCVGYKGGEYTYDKHTSCNIAYYGSTGTPITAFLLYMMLGEYGKAVQD